MPDDTPSPAPPAPTPAPAMAGGPAPGPTGPTAPATVAPDSAGMRMRGMVQVTMGLNLLDKALGLLGTNTPEGQALASALVKLRKTFGGAAHDLQRSEAKLLGERTSPISSPNPQQGQALQQMLKSKLGGMGMGAPAQPPAAA